MIDCNLTTRPVYSSKVIPNKEGASMIQRLAFSVALVALTPVLLILVVISTIYLLSGLLSISGFLG